MAKCIAYIPPQNEYSTLDRPKVYMRCYMRGYSHLWQPPLLRDHRRDKYGINLG